MLLSFLPYPMGFSNNGLAINIVQAGRSRKGRRNLLFKVLGAANPICY